MTEPRLHTRTLDEDELVLTVHALDVLHTLAKKFDLPDSIAERCDELMVRYIGDDTIAAYRASRESL